jgi:hypothetical protein
MAKEEHDESKKVRRQEGKKATEVGAFSTTVIQGRRDIDIPLADFWSYSYFGPEAYGASSRASSHRTNQGPSRIESTVGGTKSWSLCKVWCSRLWLAGFRSACIDRVLAARIAWLPVACSGTSSCPKPHVAPAWEQEY